MGLTGLVWLGFAAGHMAGNLLLFKSADAYNKYGHFLVTNPAIYLAELVLVVSLLVHFIVAAQLTMKNRAARSSRYAVEPADAKAATLAQKTMIYSGSLVLVFIIYHLVTFKFGPYYSVQVGGVEMRDLHRLVVEVFQNPFYVAWYVVCLVLLGFHLSHGFSSVFQSLGFSHPKWNPLIKKLGLAYALVVAGGFLAQPLYVYWIH